MSDPLFEILLEDNHLLAVAKPAELPTMGVRRGTSSLWTLAKAYIKRKYNKPGEVYLGVVSRLDALVSGAIVFARTSKAARRLSEQFRDGTVEKTYWALVAGVPRPGTGRRIDWLRKDERLRKMVVSRAGQPGAVEARMTYRTLARLKSGSHLEITLKTGRKHQIRVQLANLGHPILGDRKYGSRQPFPCGIALHSRQLVFQHPVRKTEVRLLAPLPPAWHELGVADD